MNGQQLPPIVPVVLRALATAAEDGRIDLNDALTFLTILITFFQHKK